MSSPAHTVDTLLLRFLGHNICTLSEHQVMHQNGVQCWHKKMQELTLRYLWEADILVWETVRASFLCSHAKPMDLRIANAFQQWKWRLMAISVECLFKTWGCDSSWSVFEPLSLCLIVYIIYQLGKMVYHTWSDFIVKMLLCKFQQFSIVTF